MIDTSGQGQWYKAVLCRTIDQDIKYDHVKENEKSREADVTEKGGFGKRIELLDGGFHFVVSLESWIIRDQDNFGFAERQIPGRINFFKENFRVIEMELYGYFLFENVFEDVREEYVRKQHVDRKELIGFDQFLLMNE